MAQQRQQGADRLPIRDPPELNIRIPHKPHRIRRTGKHLRRLPVIPLVAVTLTLALVVTFLSFRRLSRHHQEIESRSDGGNQSSARHTEVKFGHGSGGGDSRYWDRDDRRRDHDYGEDSVAHGGDDNARRELVVSTEGKAGAGGLYNEGGRGELDSYKEEYEESLKNKAEGDDGAEEVNADDEYDDGIDAQDEHDDKKTLDAADVGEAKTNASSSSKSQGKSQGKDNGKDHSGNAKTDSKTDRHGRASGSEKRPGSKKKPKRHKFSGSSCEMKFLNSTAQLVEPLVNKKFSRFTLQYTYVEERPNGLENWEPRFAGHQSLHEREESFYARDNKINCGFVKGPKGSASTGFDLADDDVKFMSSCHIAVSSCIFGNSDRLRSPFSKTITRQSRKNVCFVMFMDEITLRTLLAEGQKMDSGGFVGLWKIVVVKNLPFADMRRVGKIPKFLTHRLFPSARYSIWLDSKLRLQADPYLILEYFLWRRGYEYAISNHYDRHCVWEEVVQNKKLNKFNHTIIDQQFQFYQSDGLKRFDPSDTNRLLPSYVPEGSFIVRTHTPMSNLFSCLWFNEVDRFTPRDQLSFAYTYLKLRRMNPEKPFHLNMFKDCERRSLAKLFRHRTDEKRSIPKQQSVR